MTPMSKLPRYIDVFGPDKPKPEARPSPRTITGANGRMIAMGEPMELDLSTVRRSRRHKSTVAQDSKAEPWVYGETHPIAD